MRANYLKAFPLLFILWLPVSLIAESMTITKATGYCTDSLIQRKDHIVLSHEFDKKDNLKFFVVKLEHTINYKGGSVSFPLADDEMLLKSSLSPKVKPVLEMQAVGSGTEDSGYINHY